MGQTARKILKTGLPLLFVAYIGCISLFTHSHVVNGVTIVHSHPFNKDSEHQHTSSEFELLHGLSHIAIDDHVVFTIVLVATLYLQYKIYCKELTGTCAKCVRGILSLRAPPVIL